MLVCEREHEVGGSRLQDVKAWSWGDGIMLSNQAEVWGFLQDLTLDQQWNMDVYEMLWHTLGFDCRIVI